MTLAEWCVLGALLLYLSTIASVKWIRFRGFDNSRPRDPAFYEDALAQRALGAHQNGIEWVAPLDAQATPDEVAAALGSLKVSKLLDAFRGAPPRDIDALVDCCVRFGAFVATTDGEFAAIDLNPVFVRARGQGVRIAEGFGWAWLILPVAALLYYDHVKTAGMSSTEKRQYLDQRHYQNEAMDRQLDRQWDRSDRGR